MLFLFGPWKVEYITDPLISNGQMFFCHLRANDMEAFRSLNLANASLRAVLFLLEA